MGWRITVREAIRTARREVTVERRGSGYVVRHPIVVLGTGRFAMRTSGTLPFAIARRRRASFAAEIALQALYCPAPHSDLEEDIRDHCDAAHGPIETIVDSFRKNCPLPRGTLVRDAMQGVRGRAVRSGYPGRIR